MKFGAKNKIFLLAAVWVILVAVMFLYLFPILGNSNAALTQSLTMQRQKVQSLQTQVSNYTLSSGDLTKVKTESLQPASFFSQDVTLVSELQVLQTLASTTSVQMTLSGLSGTVDQAQKAPTLTTIYQIPYSLNLTGSFNNVVSFLQGLENMPFVTTVSQITITSSGSQTDSSVIANLNAYFYLRP